MGYGKSAGTKLIIDGNPQVNTKIDAIESHLQFINRRNDRDSFGVQYPQNKSSISFIIDDGFKSAYDYRNTFANKGAKASVALVTDWMDGISEYDSEIPHMSWDNARELMYDYGWEISSHTKTHAGWDGITAEEAKTELQNAHKRFVEERLIPLHLTYPGGQVGTTEHQAAVSQLYSYGFGLNDRVLDYRDSYYTISRFIIDNVDLSDIINKIDEAKDNNTALVFCIHRIIDGNREDENASEVSTGKIEDIIDYAVANDVKVLLPTEAMRLANHPITNERRLRRVITDSVDSPVTSGRFSEGLIGKWMVKEGKGDTVYNESLPLYHGSIVGAEWNREGHIQSLDFIENGDKIEISPDIDNHLRNDAITICAWMKMNSLNLDDATHLWSDWTASGDNRSSYIQINDNKITFRVSTNGTTGSSAHALDVSWSPFTDKWCFVGATFDNGSMLLQVWDTTKMVGSNNFETSFDTINLSGQEKHFAYYPDGDTTAKILLSEHWVWNRGFSDKDLRWFYEMTREKYKS